MPVLPKYRSDFTNRGEKEIYEKAIGSNYFNSAKRYFIHSLRSHNTKNKLVGEVDFVYLDDQFVIFLEAKSGAVTYDSSKDEWWVLGGKKKGDPFKQVTDYLFYIRDRIFPKYFPDKYYHQRLIFGYGVMFPDIERKLSFDKKTKKSSYYKNETIEYDPQIIYSSNFHENPNGLEDYLEHLKNYWINHDKYAGRSIGIGIKDLEEIRKLFRKDLVFEIPVSTVLSKETAAIEKFTEDQFGVLDTFDLVSSKGMIVIGGPGTGKTVMAKELLVRQALEGKSCAYFCYNRNLAGEVDRYFSSLDAELNISSFNVHSYIHNALSEKELLPIHNEPYDHYYWNTKLPLQFKLWHKTLDLERFDFIVIDEGQDIFSENIIDAIFLNLKDSVESGSWTIFVDHKYQGFYQGFDKDFYKLFMDLYPCTIQMLPINCRNHTDILSVACSHTGFDSMPCRRTKVPFKTTAEFYKNEKELINLVNLKINKWIKDGVPHDKITILAPNKKKLTLVKEILNHPYHVVNVEVHLKKGHISLSTIHSYKGLENDFVLVVGLDEYDRSIKNDMSLIFVAYSRAIMGLSILMDECIKIPLVVELTYSQSKDEQRQS